MARKPRLASVLVLLIIGAIVAFVGMLVYESQTMQTTLERNRAELRKKLEDDAEQHLLLEKREPGDRFPLEGFGRIVEKSTSGSVIEYRGLRFTLDLDGRIL